MSNAPRPRRSVLYMPGANAKALEKGKSLPADVLILDLEDSVAPDAKEDARAQVGAVLDAGGYGQRELIVRANGLATPWGGPDIAALASKPLAGVLVPKVETSDDVLAADEALGASGAGDNVALWVMIETPKAILNLKKIAAAARKTRLAGLVMGLNDLAKDMRARGGADRAPFQPALALSVTAARAYGLIAIDGVFNDIADAEGLEAECKQGFAFGFDGKTLIHPSQIDVCNRVFAPSEQEVAWSRAVIAAFALPDNAGKGVIKVEGRMTELLHLEEARRVVAIAEAIEARA
ncbi:MAG TPA: CoA ester lyase [Caulobacterales bacterium]|nr:CoA ester lyase [Caulobacterales bacterium]